MYKKNIQKFCLLTTQRSGSSWLRSLLDSHPNTRVYGEIFLYKKPKLNNKIVSFFEYNKQSNVPRPYKIFKYLDSIVETNSADIKAIGFKLMYDQLLRKPEILLKLIIDRYKIIHLVRNNYLDTIISYELAKQNNLFHTRNNAKIKPICLDENNIIPMLKNQKKKVNMSRKLLQIIPNNTLEVCYENLQMNECIVIREILSFLRLHEAKNVSLSSDLRKINNKPYQEIITNYQEIVTILQNTEFGNLLKI